MLVSVVVPCYNSRDYVGEALESVFGQTHEDLELICVDDGSRDGTADLLEQIRAGSRIPMEVIRLARNSGACAARNAGLRVARGTFVQFLDSDDVLLPDKIAHQLELVEREDGSVDLVTADAIWRLPGGEESVHYVDRRGPFFGLLGSRLGSTGPNLWGAKMLRRVGGFNDRMRTSNEYELMFRMLEAGARTLLDPVPKMVMRRRRNSLSQTDRGDFLVRFLRLRKEMLEYAESQGIATPELRQCGRDVIFQRLRGLWKQDRREAERMYAELLPRRFVPSRQAAGLRYVTLLRAFGFGKAQRLAPMVGLSF